MGPVDSRGRVRAGRFLAPKWRRLRTMARARFAMHRLRPFPARGTASLLGRSWGHGQAEHGVAGEDNRYRAVGTGGAFRDWGDDFLPAQRGFSLICAVD